MIRDLFARQPVLAAFGVFCIAGALPCFAAQSFDARTLHDVNVWVKPTKFFVSVGVFALTLAWFFGYVRPERRRSAPMLFVIAATLLAGGFELVYIALQAWRGMDSHFNITAPFYIMMYALMGVGAVTLVSTTLPLAWEIARRPVEGLRSDYRAAVVVGLVATFVLGGGLGGYMSSTLSHSVGAEGGHSMIFGWNRSGGDLRVAHFFGMHMMQGLPMLAALVSAAPAFVRWGALGLGAAFGTALTVVVFVQALMGQPVPVAL